ncbi:MAG: Peptidoglycan O-acetyltransferase [Firmicutes bacterium]|nr:Peptidoglycan O-acetyltransferase [Bacillota bacterium]
MPLTSVTFLGFFLPILLLLYYIRSNRMWRNMILLLFSLVFYALFSPFFVIAIVLLTGIVYVAARLQAWLKEISLGRTLIWLVAALNIGTMLALYLRFPHLTVPVLYHLSFPMPLLLTIFVLQAHGYLMDVHNETVRPEMNLWNLLLGLAFFPQMIAGPIIRYRDFYLEVQTRQETWAAAVAGLARGAVGIIKIGLLGPYLGGTVDFLLRENLAALSASGAWLGIALFLGQWYLVLSGFADLSIGLGKIFGFSYPEQFSHPLASRSISQFLERWCISTLAFIREYLPRRGTGLMQRTLILALIIGWWHGLGWNALLWGLVFASFLIFDQILLSMSIHQQDIPVLGNILTWLSLALLGSIFYYNDLAELAQFLASLLALSDLSISLTAVEAEAVQRIFWLLPFALLFTTPLPNKALDVLSKRWRYTRLVTQSAVSLGLLFFLLLFWSNLLPSTTPWRTLISEQYLVSWLKATPTYATQVARFEALISYEGFVERTRGSAEREIATRALARLRAELATALPHKPITPTGDEDELGLAPKIDRAGYLVLDQHIVFYDRVVTLFADLPDSQASFWQSINEVMGNMPATIKKYLLIAPMSISFEQPEHRQYSGDLQAAIARVHARLLPEIVSLDSFAYLMPHSDEKLFMNTNPHWTALGAYYAAQGFSQALGVEFVDITEYELRSFHGYLGSLASVGQASGFGDHQDKVDYYLHRTLPNNQMVHRYDALGQLQVFASPAVALSRRGYNIFLGVGQFLSVLEGTATNERVLLIVGDDSRRAFAPWLVPSFEKILVLDSVHYRGGQVGLRQLIAAHQVTDFLIIANGAMLSSPSWAVRLRDALLR